MCTQRRTHLLQSQRPIHDGISGKDPRGEHSGDVVRVFSRKVPSHTLNKRTLQPSPHALTVGDAGHVESGIEHSKPDSVLTHDCSRVQDRIAEALRGIGECGQSVEG